MNNLPVPALSFRAPGKINLGLAVGDLDVTGYHSLRNLFQAVELFEDIEIHAAGQFDVSFAGPVDTSGLTGTNTLVHRAAHLVAAAAGLDPMPGARIEVLKRVPIAGGMGGGSADAAATLVACNELWSAGLNHEQLHALAAQLGADVPFALHGGTQLGTGRGDQLVDVLSPGRYTWLLVPSAIGLSTPAVYAELDRMRECGEAPSTDLETDARTDELLVALRSKDPRALAPALFNDLDAAACSLLPALETTRQVGLNAGALAGFVSGSGPTVVFLARDNEHGLDVQLGLREQHIDSVMVHSPARGVL